MLHIALADATGKLSRTELDQLAHIGTEYAGAVGSFFGVQATAQVYARSAPPHAWPITFYADSDQADALAYHEVDDKGRPAGRIFVDTLANANASLTVGYTHELGEMLGDPFCVLGSQVNAGVWVAQEICDPVEADECAWHIGGVPVSDFVTPAWFTPGLPGPVSFNGGVTKALTLAAGGYASIERNGKWTQQFADRPDFNASMMSSHLYTDDGDPAPSLRAATSHRIHRRTLMVELAVALGNDLSGST